MIVFAEKFVKLKSPGLGAENNTICFIYFQNSILKFRRGFFEVLPKYPLCCLHPLPQSGGHKKA
jgi:hypothetical protein